MASRLRAAELLPLAPAAAIPLLFLHRRYQGHASFGPVDVFPSDLAVAVVVGAALFAGLRWGFAPLRRARTLWFLAASLLVLIVVSCFWSPADQTTKHLVTAAKFAEYALLAPALVLLLRRRIDVDRLLLAVVLWASAASGWGLLQFLGVVAEFEGKNPAQREPSFLGIEQFAALSGAALAIAFTAIALGKPWSRTIILAAVAGTLGVALAASVFGFLGVLLAALLTVAVARRTLSRRRLAALAAIVVLGGAGVYGLRAGDASNFFSFLGHGTPSASSSEEIQTGSQRVMLSYIGLRIWADHPLLGVGFERSLDRYQPYLADAHRKYPDESANAFPSEQNKWGVQNFWVQLLADVGLVGFALALATFGLGLLLAVRAASLVGLVAAGWILVTVGSLNGAGIVAGVPLDALAWLGLGLAATSRGLE